MLAERVRDLLAAEFKTVYIVADVQSLQEGAQHLTPAVIVLDLSLGGRDSTSLLKQVFSLSPTSKVIALSVYDDAAVARAALNAGVHAVVLKRSIGSDLHDAIGTVLSGKQFVSKDFELADHSI